MTRELLNTGWSYRPKVTAFQELGGAAGTPWQDVTLPHDAVITTPRRADAPGGHTNGYFDGGAFEYRRTLTVPADWAGKSVFLEFDGVYRDAVVTVNGAFVGRRALGYSRFVVRVDPHLRFGADNEIRVACRSHLDSRWYTGAGIYRDVRLIVKDAAHLAVDGTQVTTPDVDAEYATVEVTTRVANREQTTQTLRVTATLVDRDGREVATTSAPVTVLPGEIETVRLTTLVSDPQLWSADAPTLYEARVALSSGDAERDSETIRFGIRTVQADAKRGLRVNGQPVKLRGACLHADNGALGAAAIGRAEERKIALLKAAGFNAIRSSHHPASSALLEACDRLGMYVMDEAFDMWTQGKSDFDYAADFPVWWEQDIEDLVAKDVNHPSVIFYSIGNEIPETGTPDGARWSRRLADKIRSLDDTRLITNGINGFVSALDMVLAGMRQRREAAAADGAEQAGGVNQMMSSFGAMMGQITASPMVTAATEESFAALDVAGLNYGESRYELDGTQFPDRVIVGSETWPNVIDRNWELVKRLPHVIGDFTWTGMDYLGETGIGVVAYADDAGTGRGFSTPYPGLTAFSGDLDLTGHRRPVSYYREIVFGLRTEPFIAVQRPDRYDSEIAVATPWSWSDTVDSWSWPDAEGRPVRVEVYADADEVELLLDGDALARAAVGAQRAFRADFDTVYRPGTLTAVAYRDGAEIGRTQLRSAVGEVRVDAAVDRDEITADTRDLAFVTIALTDADGTLVTGFDRPVTVSVDGAGVLQGINSGAPVTPESFADASRRTWDGRAVAVVRPTGTGEIAVCIEAEGCEPVTVAISSIAASSGDDRSADEVDQVEGAAA